MKGLSQFLFAALAVTGDAYAQTWQTYTYPDPGFAIQFPAVPEVKTSKVKSSLGMTLPLTRYVARQDGVEYALSVLDYSNTNADALSTIADAARSFSASGQVNADSGARVSGSHGRELTVTEKDGSRSDIAIFFVDHHLYTAVGHALMPNATQSSADTERFRESLQFPRDDSGFLGLFGRRNKPRPAATPSSDAAVTDHPASSSNAGAHSKPAADADAVCVGKSPGDVVQLNTPAGPVAATCTLTARPNAPAGHR